MANLTGLGTLENLPSSELEEYLQNDFKSLGQEELNRNIDLFLSKIKYTLELADDLKKKEALLSLNILIEADLCSKIRLGELIDPIKKTLSSSDTDVIKVCATTIGVIAVALVTTSTEFFDKEVRRANENLLTSDKYEPKYSSVLVLKELASRLPSFFFQQMPLFFSAIFVAFRDPKIALREEAATALRAVLKIACQRESQSQTKPAYYQQCMDEIDRSYGEGVRKKLSLEEWTHGWMLILNELLRCCGANVEMTCSNEEAILFNEPKIESYKRDKTVLEGHSAIELLINSSNENNNNSGDDDDDVTQFPESKFIKEMVSFKILRLTVNVLKHRTSKYAFIHRCMLHILPRIAAICPRVFYFNHLDETLDYIKTEHKGKDKAQSFVCLGLVCLTMKDNIGRHKNALFSLLHQHLLAKDKKAKNQRAVQSSVFACVCMLADAILNNDTNNNNTNNNNNENKTISFNCSIANDVDDKSINNNNNNNNNKNIKNKEEFLPFIESIFSLGLSQPMLKALERLTKVDDALKRFIQISMLRKLHVVLVAKELQHPYYVDSIAALPQCSSAGLAGSVTQGAVSSQTAVGSVPRNSAWNLLLNKNSQSLEDLLAPEGFSNRERKSPGYLSPQSSLPPPSPLTSIRNSLPPPSPLTSIRNSLPRRMSMLKTQQAPLTPKQDDVALALKTLGEFDFEGFCLARLVEYCIGKFLSHDRKDIKINTILTATKLLANNYLSNSQTSEHAYMDLLTCRVLSKVLSAAVVDEDADIRYCALSSLHPRFDHCLAHIQCLQLLSSCVHDEDIDVREMAVCIVGRVSLCNPSFVLPLLRKIIVRVLTELDYSGQDKNKVQSSHLISHLSRCAPTLIRTYARPIVDVILPMLKDHAKLSTPVIIALLEVIGDIAQVTGPSFVRMCDIIIPIIITILQESPQSPSKRRVALRTLNQLVSGLCYPIEPYMKHPQLLAVIMSFFKSDMPSAIKKEAMKALGTLGALDPFKLKGISNQPMDDPGIATSLSNTKAAEEAKSQEISSNELLVNMTTLKLDNFYPAVAVTILLKMLKDPSLSAYHTSVVLAISAIFKSLGYKGLDFLVKVFPLYCDLIKSTNDYEFKKLLLNNMAVITKVMKQYVKSYLPDIFVLIHDLWQTNSALTAPIIQLLESIVSSVDCDFRTYLPHFVPFLLNTFHEEQDATEKPNSIALMVAMREFGNHLDDYMHFILPPVISIFSTRSNPVHVRRTALETVLKLCEQLDLSDFASRILLTIRRVTDESWELNDICTQVVAALTSQLSHTSASYADLVLACLSKQQSYTALVQTAQLIDGTRTLPSTEPGSDTEAQSSRNHDSSSPPCVAKLKVNSEALEKAWASRKQVSQDEWLDWLRRLNMEMIKESPSPAFRALYPLANDYNPLAKELFNAAFVSCWMELTDQQQQELSSNLKRALEQTDLLELTQCMLNLTQFIEHCENCTLPLDLDQLSESALKCRAYAKALHLKEVEFRNGPTNQILESLLSINNKLQQPEAAQGVLEYAKKQSRSDLKVQERWYEKLHDWSRALASYEKQQEKHPGNVTFMLGRMRCLEALGEWGKLHDIALERWAGHEEAVKENMARMCATAALGLGDWDNLPEYMAMIPHNTYDSCFYKGVISIYNGNYHLAQKAIDQARQLLINEMTTLAGEGYSRAYEVMVNVQMLNELEEVMEYKVVPEKRVAIKELWWARLKGCQNILEDWQRFLQIRTLVMKPQEDVRPWLKYTSLCRKNNRMTLAERTFTMLLGKDPKRMSDEELVRCERNVVYTFLKHSWSDERKREGTFDRLKTFLEHLSPLNLDYAIPDHDPFLSKCYHKLAVWYTTNNKRSNIVSVTYFNESLKYNGDSLKAWHSFAYANYEVVLALKQLSNDSADETTINKISSRPLVEHCKASIKGFIHSILQANSTQTLQDTLRLLTLWFEYGELADVNQIVSDGFNSIMIENWIQVIPQLIARIDIKKPLIENLIKQLLIQVARMHPQALIYPLTVALKSGVKSRSEAACVVINSMREMYNNTVQQASVISEELIRVAILWHELWHEGLEEASRLYFGNKNIVGMLATLEPLHTMILAGAKTLKETAFVKSYGADLNTAYDCCCRYNKTHNPKELTQAWDIYYQVFRRITKQLPQLTALQLKYVSPKLLDCENLDVTVPGTYLANQPQINIAKVYNEVSVITSKQRPRKLTVRGSDGQDFQFLLKGHEDLRQDERVMQLFGLVNSILLANPQSPRRNLSIQRYSVIPLSTNIGLIGWVPNCDTLHSLIRDYREKKKILLNIEHRIMLRVFQDYERLMLMQKVEVFEHALETTKGDDLAQILWNKSASSEVWFDRRTNYTRSLAVMSVVGYILGLGDRHPSNLMLDRLTGKIMHIDFGDCFEVAMHREKFPEKIPFRLTRMLINAMEVTGIDGNYRITCENVMKILRSHKDSLMAVLEAFIYDPLLNWKLLDATTKKSSGMNDTHNMQPTQDLANLSTSYSSALTANNSNQATNPIRPPPPPNQPEEINKKGLLVLNRVKDKLTGRDFNNDEAVDVTTQIKMLIDQATRHEHLCQCYIGWCPFW